MEFTWASGAVELLKHGIEHSRLNTAFDKRIAWISIDNAVEVAVKVALSMPKQFWGGSFPSIREVEECKSSFPRFLDLLYQYKGAVLVGVEQSDLEYYHRIRNKLYHDGTGFSVDQIQLDAFVGIAKLLIQRLFDIKFSESKSSSRSELEKLIYLWSSIHEKLIELHPNSPTDFRQWNWNYLSNSASLDESTLDKINAFIISRNKIMHSEIVDSNLLNHVLHRAEELVSILENLVEKSRLEISGSNLFYKPFLAQIQGKLVHKQYYGPPGYGDSPEVDLNLNSLILELDKPINIHQTENELEEGDPCYSRFGVEQIHLVGGLPAFQEMIGKRVQIRGYFDASNRAWHFVPVLMEIVSLKSII